MQYPACVGAEGDSAACMNKEKHGVKQREKDDESQEAWRGTQMSVGRLYLL